MNMTALLNEPNVHERRSKTFSDLKKNSKDKDISNVKFYSFIPFKDNININNNNNKMISNINSKESLDITFTSKKKNYENHFNSIDKTNSNLISMKEHDNEKENFNDFKKTIIENAKTLDTIDESSDDKISVLMDSCRTIDLTKDEADTIMLNLVLNNENTLYKKKNKLQNNNNDDVDDLITIGDKSVTTGNKIFPFNSTLQKYWFTIFVKTGFILDKMELIIYENFWFTLLYLNFWFPKFTGFLSAEIIGREDFDFNNPIPPKTFSLSYLIKQQLQQLRKLLKLNFLRVQIRYRRSPYSTLFYSSLTVATILPVSLFFMTLFAMGTSYFFIYMSFFITFGFISSFLIIPLLSTSFIFAIGVVIFGFISNITFKSGQFIYYKADKKLKNYLELMAYNLQKKPSTVVTPNEIPIDNTHNILINNSNSGDNSSIDEPIISIIEEE